MKFAERIYNFLDGFNIFQEALVCLLTGDNYFWNVINTGWYEMYIYPYDDMYTPILSKERQLRLDQKLERIVLSPEDFDSLLERINSPPKLDIRIKKVMSRVAPWDDVDDFPKPNDALIEAKRLHELNVESK
jgi:hypothetical protein